MRDTTKNILDASLKVFKAKGYLKATTKAIAQEAGVAEVTLYRKFKTKKALFEATLRKHLDLSFEETLINPKSESQDFFKRLLENRLELMSRQKDFIALLIRESLADTLPRDLHFNHYVHTRLKSIIETHLHYVKISKDIEKITRMVIGILLSYLMMPSSTSYHLLEPKEKTTVVNTYTKLIIKAIT